eukprot:SAG11_NODE_2419_length_3380_cov_3.142030_2_plen_101_part_00
MPRYRPPAPHGTTPQLPPAIFEMKEWLQELPRKDDIKGALWDAHLLMLGESEANRTGAQHEENVGRNSEQEVSDIEPGAAPRDIVAEAGNQADQDNGVSI